MMVTDDFINYLIVLDNIHDFQNAVLIPMIKQPSSR
jgi:hypothetical protein